MNIKLYAAVALMLSLIAVAPAQTKREVAAAPPSDAAIQKNQLQNNCLPDSKTRVFEIRTYTTSQKMEVYQEFFQNTTVQLFKKHGFEPVGYWVPQDPPRSKNTFIYILAFPDRETAKAKWDAFFKDPKWVKDRADFIAKHGKILDNIDSQFVSPVNFSPLK
ncbi:MAG: NIPSNAP family protein [Acidobacteriota bacterium]|nr:NIPSNAP family protein [Acidobacteriota bacterium]